MSLQVDISKLSEKVLAHPDIAPAFINPQSAIEPAFVRRELAARETDIRAEASSVIGEFDAVENELSSKRGQILIATADRWFETIFWLTFGLLFLLAIAYGACRFFGWPPARFVDQWLQSSLHRGLQQAISATLVSGIVGLGVLTAYWSRIVRPRRRESLSQSLDIAGVEKRLDDIRSRAESALDAAMLQNALAIVNAANDDFFQITLQTPKSAQGQGLSGARITSATGLSEIAIGENVIPTESLRVITGLIETLPGASIGISGPRGVGKSTLLTSLCSTNLRIGGAEAISIYTASPVEYDPREFLLHIFSSLCRQLLKTRGLDDDAIRALTSESLGVDGRARIAGIGVSRLGLSISMAGVTTAFFGIVVAFFMWQTHLPTVTAASTTAHVQVASAVETPTFWDEIDLKPGPLILWGGVIAFLGSFATAILTMQTVGREGGGRFIRATTAARLGRPTPPRVYDDGLVQFAIRKLRDIQFQRSFTTGWSGALKIPVGIELASNGSVSYSQSAESLPELVSEFKNFVGRIVAEKSYGRVVIGIDELDKLHSAAGAERFLNEIKTIFNIPRCYYLVSVSENALSNFERRGLPVRDAFDSAFDDILHVDYLSLQSSRNLLMRRILNLPGPYLCLCHVLSGGLPRDLIRIARSMMALANNDAPPPNLGTMVSALVRGEALVKLRATSIAAREIRVEPELTGLQMQIAGLEAANRIGSMLTTVWTPVQQFAPRSDAEEVDNVKKLEQIRKELASYLDFLNLVQTLFVGMTTEKIWRNARASGIVDALAGARQGFELGVGIAEFRIGSVRQAVPALFAQAPTDQL